MKKIIIFTLIFVLLGALAGCADDVPEDVSEPGLTKQASLEYQFSGVHKGDTIAEIVIRDYGSIKIRLFPEDAPKTVENFTTLAENGAYDGTVISGVVQDYMIQCGTSETDSAGYSIYGEYFEDEFSEKLHPFRGALCMANLGTANTNASQFFIVGQTAQTLSEVDELLAYKGRTMEEYMQKGYGTHMSEELLEKYYTYGGTPWLYEHNTVFGQMYEGFEVLDELLKARTDEKNTYVPMDDIIIDTIKISTAE